MTEPDPAPLVGRAAADKVAQYGETKALLETALRSVHHAMAATPWFDQVKPLGEISTALATALAAHVDVFHQATTPRKAHES